MSKEWEELPGDLLRKIEDRLILYDDKVRLRCVCKYWQSEVSSPSRFQLPLLLLPSKIHGASHEFFNITDNTTYYLDLHKLHEFDSLSLRGSSHGWVVAFARSHKGGNSAFMFNPLTGFKKQLTSTTYYYRRTFREDIIKCVVSSNPGLSDDFMVVALLDDEPMSLAYAKLGDDIWNEIRTTEYLADITFYKGRLYGLTYDARLMRFEIGSSKPEVAIQILPPKNGVVGPYLSLIDSRVGLLMVDRVEDRDRDDKTIRFNVYKYDCRAGQWSSKLTRIGDDMLFVGLEDEVSISLKSGLTLTGFKENNIQFFDLEYGGWNDPNVINMGLFDLKTGKTEQLPASKRSSPLIPFWFTPS